MSKGRPAYQTSKSVEDEEDDEQENVTPPLTLKDGIDADKGFYISFEEAPKRPSWK
jgi:hypothetical protein